LDENHWATAKEPPDTIIAGSTSLVPFQPDMMNTSQNGTNRDNSGSWRPTIWPMANASSPVTAPAVTMGIPIAPKATGAVLAIRQMPAA